MAMTATNGDPVLRYKEALARLRDRLVPLVADVTDADECRRIVDAEIRVTLLAHAGLPAAAGES